MVDEDKIEEIKFFTLFTFLPKIFSFSYYLEETIDEDTTADLRMKIIFFAWFWI